MTHWLRWVNIQDQARRSVGLAHSGCCLRVTTMLTVQTVLIMVVMLDTVMQLVQI